MELALARGAERIEPANVQFHGRAWRDRDALLPDRTQVARARAAVERWRQWLAGRREVVWVVPDHVDWTARPCVGGWGARSLTVAPDGTALPCPAAATLPGLGAPNVKDHTLEWDPAGFGRVPRLPGARSGGANRGDCAPRTADFAGCRCQAHALTGDATRADPACRASPDHGLVEALVDRPHGWTETPAPYIYRARPPHDPGERGP
ncbi:hypothetical protein [Streptomyces sp. NPDC050856]|uniref:hypothetical protein n=1 Tax=Streptomyces sp. NPDC050856 TaxID=3154939 RepID=UPI0033F4CD84